MGGKSRGGRAVHVALLRGINLGSVNRLPMKELAAMFDAAGCGTVQIYIQSGNVVFEAPAALAARVPTVIAAAIADRFGYRVPVVTRTAAELAAVAAANPFLRAGADPAVLHVVFLASPPGPAQIAALDPDRSPPDRFAVKGREVYLHCPNGYGRSKLHNDYFESRLGSVSTVRNWRTVLRLVEMSGGRESTAAAPR
jgi:uncharacterized protein (DUF1697 family)